MEKINALQTKEYIVTTLRNEILSGNIKAGERLRQETIAEMLCVSRMPVREAFLTLEKEGFIRRLPNRHMEVVGIHREDILLNFKVLGTMECELSSALLGSNKDITPLMQECDHYETIASSSNIEEEAKTELEIHKLLSKLLENQYLIQIHHTLLDGYYTFMRTNMCDNIDNIHERFKEVINGLRSKDKEKTAESIKKYYEEVGIQSARNRSEIKYE